MRSQWGLWPPDFVYEDQPYPQNRFNRWLWECWMDMCKNHPKADLLIVNGDVDDGDQPADRGRSVKTTDEDAGKDAAIAVLEPAVSNAREWILIRGTDYHESRFTAIARALHAKRWPNGARHGQVLSLEAAGVLINTAHHPEGGPVLYKGTTLDKTILWSLIASKLEKVPDARLIIRSHWHFYASMQANGRTAVQAPAWQLITPYAVKRSYFRFQPDIGFVDVLIRTDEPYPVLEPILYPYPKTLNPIMRVS